MGADAGGCGFRVSDAPGASQLFDGAPNNIAYDAHIGDKAATDAAFAKAAQVARIKVVNQRVVANYMEPRAAVGEYDAAAGRLTPARRQPGRPRPAATSIAGRS